MRGHLHDKQRKGLSIGCGNPGRENPIAMTRAALEQIGWRGSSAKFAAQAQHGLPDGLQRNLHAAALTQQSGQVAGLVPLIGRAQQQTKQGVLSRGQRDFFSLTRNPGKDRFIPTVGSK